MSFRVKHESCLPCLHHHHLLSTEHTNPQASLINGKVHTQINTNFFASRFEKALTFDKSSRYVGYLSIITVFTMLLCVHNNACKVGSMYVSSLFEKAKFHVSLFDFFVFLLPMKYDNEMDTFSRYIWEIFVLGLRLYTSY